MTQVRKGRPPIYDWDKILSRPPGTTGPYKVTCRYGDDYHCSNYGFAQSVRNRSYINGIRVSVSVPQDEPPRVEITVLGKRKKFARA